MIKRTYNKFKSSVKFTKYILRLFVKQPFLLKFILTHQLNGTSLSKYSSSGKYYLYNA